MSRIWVETRFDVEEDRGHPTRCRMRSRLRRPKPRYMKVTERDLPPRAALGCKLGPVTRNDPEGRLRSPEGVTNTRLRMVPNGDEFRLPIP